MAGTRRLVQAVDRSRLRHLVYVSIVGVDRIGVHAPGAHVVATPLPGKLTARSATGPRLPAGGARGRRTYAEHLHG